MPVPERCGISNSLQIARDNEGSGENSDNNEESEEGGGGWRGGYSDLVDWTVGKISSSLTARLPFVLKPEGIQMHICHRQRHALTKFVRFEQTCPDPSLVADAPL